MPSFEIPDGPTTVPLMSQSVKGKAMRTAVVTFTVTNKTDQPVACRLKVAPQADAQAEWFDVQGERERPFATSETQKVTVSVAVPAEVKPTDFKFRLQAMNVNDPGNDYAESAVATLGAAPTPTSRPASIWPYLVIAAVLLLIVGGVATVLLVPHKPPPVVTVEVPDVSTDGTQVFAGAQAILQEHGFTAIRVDGPATGKPPGTVMSQLPAAHTQVAKAGEVKVTVDPGVTIPREVIGQQVTLVGDRLSGFSASFTALGDNGQTGQIVALDPPAGVVAKGSPLTVLIHSPGCRGFVCLEGRVSIQEIQAFELSGPH